MLCYHAGVVWCSLGYGAAVYCDRNGGVVWCGCDSGGGGLLWCGLASNRGCDVV